MGHTETQLTEFSGGVGADLPDTYEWQDRATDLPGGLRVVVADESISPNGGGILSQGVVSYVLGGEQSFLAAHRDRELDVPPYYSRFDEWELYIGPPSAKSRATCYGIRSSRLEAAIRVADGPGRMSSDVEVIACGKHPFLVRGERGTFAVSTEHLDADLDPEDEAVPTWEVAGMEVPEESETLRSGIDTFVDVTAEYAGVEITGYDEIRDGKHIFETADGRGIKARGHHFRRLAKATTDVDTIAGNYDYEDPWDETFVADVMADDIEHDIGEQAWSGTVVGYKLSWDDPRRTRRASLSGRVKLKIDHVCLIVRDKEPWDVRVESKSETVAEWRPENKKYNPLGV